MKKKEQKIEETKSEKKHKKVSDKSNSKKLQEEIENLKAENSTLTDTILRKAAEFENFKRRKEVELSNIFKYTGESLVLKILPVVDDFERSLAHINDAKDVDSIKKGLQLVYDKLMKTLNEQGIKKIEVKGKEFDVEFHEALMQRKDENAEPNTVLDEIETGYIYKDKVIRHAKVIVNEEAEQETKLNKETDK